MGKQLYDRFCTMFPAYGRQVVNWGHEGNHLLRVTLEDHSILVFLYQDANDWQLMTIKAYTKTLSDAK